MSVKYAFRIMTYVRVVTLLVFSYIGTEEII